MNNKILVTGGAGFIGGHLVDALISKGYRVVVLDNLFYIVHRGKLPEWFNKKAEFIKGDVRKKKDLQKALKGVSAIFHLAGYMDFHPDYSNYIDINTRSASIIFEIINEEKLPIKKVIVASSQAVYGEGQYICDDHGLVFPGLRSEADLLKSIWQVKCPTCQKEVRPQILKEDLPVFPVNIYGISKEFLEKTSFELGKNLRIPVIATRLSIVHGPRQTIRHFYSGALRQFATMALSGKPIEMHEDGEQKRDFVHIYDVIDAYLKILEDDRANTKIYNIGSGKETSVRQLAIEILNYLKTDLPIRTNGIFRANTSRFSVSDISKLKKLGWQPKKHLKDNVADYLLWLKKIKPDLRILNRQLGEMQKRGIVKKIIL